MSSTTRATDLKQVFSKFGKVIGAKVVTNARTPGARCYGYVTMASSEDATKSIQFLHLTELHGRMISVEKVCNFPCLLYNQRLECSYVKKCITFNQP